MHTRIMRSSNMFVAELSAGFQRKTLPDLSEECVSFSNAPVVTLVRRFLKGQPGTSGLVTANCERSLAWCHPHGGSDSLKLSRSGIRLLRKRRAVIWWSLALDYCHALALPLMYSCSGGRRMRHNLLISNNMLHLLHHADRSCVQSGS